MTTAMTNDLLLRAARGERTPRPPVWLMRQAGRTDPEYNALRERCGLPLHDLFRHAELSAEISLLPARFGVDAIIYFQDILTPLAPMGAPFVFNPGPVFERPIRSEEDAAALHPFDMGEELAFIPEIFARVKATLDGAMPVLGFAGAPLTLLVFLAEGKSFGASAPHAMALLREKPAVARALLDKLTRVTIDYLRFQIEAGADAVQLFESAAHLLDETAYREFALPYQQQVFDALGGAVPTIMFAREWGSAPLLKQSGASIMSLSAEIGINQARAELGADTIVQGNLDNVMLAEGREEDIAAAVQRIVAEGECRGHIFNLSHGLLKHTPFERVCRLIEQVKEAAEKGQG